MGRKAGFVNITSLTKHIEQLHLYIRERSAYRLFAIAESHLSPAVDSRLVDIDEFSILRHDRNRYDGGLVLYVHNSLKAKILSRSDATIPTGRPKISEYMICIVQQGRDPAVLVAVIYRPPYIPFIKGSNLIDKLTTCVDDCSH